MPPGLRHATSATIATAATEVGIHGLAPSMTRKGSRRTTTPPAMRRSTMSRTAFAGPGVKVPISVGRKRTRTTRTGTSVATSAGAHIRRRNAPAPPPPSVCRANRFVRLDTGSHSDAVFANQTVVSAKTRARRRACTAMRTTTGVRSTAVVSRDRNAVKPTAMTTTNNHKTMVRPRASRARREATSSKTPAWEASSATTVAANAKSRTGQTRSPSATASAVGSRPMATAPPPSRSSTMPRTPRRMVTGYDLHPLGPLPAPGSRGPRPVRPR